MTTDIEDAILAAVALGVPYTKAARGAGVSLGTVGSHAKRNPDFAKRLKRAEASCIGELIQKIQDATEKQWQAAAWMLERRWPEHFAKREPDRRPPKPATTDVELWQAARATLPSSNGSSE